MTAKITITAKQPIDHNDPTAAGFELGYTWRVEDDLGTFESSLPTRDEALEHAKSVARGHGYLDDQIEID